jgi:2-polyprenyl-3-methyl-5-hydroxy-6-metoxy-1,4-benzoquinol methylase
MPPDANRVERYFERTAEQFDALYDEGRGLRYWWNRLLRRALFERVRMTLEELRELRDFTVLDVGCGSGRNCVLFVQAGARRVVGIDLAEKMVKLASERAHRHGVEGKAAFLRSDLLSYAPEEKFDAVVALGVFDYLADARANLEGMATLASGKVIASFPGVSLVRAPLRKLRYALQDCPVFFYTRRELETLAREAGLTDYRLLPCAGAGYLLVARVGRRLERAAGH